MPQLQMPNTTGKLAYSAVDQAQSGLAFAERVRDNRDSLVSIGIPSMDKIVNPLIPSDLLLFITSSGNGKSSFLNWWSYNRAAILKRSGLAETHSTVMVTTESVIEKAFLKWQAVETGVSVSTIVRGETTDDQIESMRRFGKKHATMPIWIIGRSSENPDPDMKMDTGFVIRALWELRKYTVIDSVFIDHLHDFDDDIYAGDAEKYSAIVKIIKSRIANGMGLATILAAQAKREVHIDGLKPLGNPIPGKTDTMWTSKAEQAADCILAGCRPSLYRDIGGSLNVGGKSLHVDSEDLYVWACHKQREGPVGNYGKLYWNPAHNRWGDVADV